VLGDIGPAVPQRPRALHEVGVVPSRVTPAALGRVSRGAVEFHAQPVLLVQVVQVAQVAQAAAVPAPCLPPGGGEPVRALHAEDVAALERGVHPVAGILERGGDPPAPPHPRPSRERLAEQLRRGQLAPHRRRDPAIRVIEGPRRRDQVEHRVLHRRPRQLPRRHPLRHQPPPPVNHHPPDRLPSRGMLVGWNADVNARTRLVDELVNLSSRLVTEHGTWPCPQHGSPQPGLTGRDPGKGRVHPSVQLLPVSRVQAPIDRLLSEAGVHRLLSRDHTGL
jgi:hypothetical protein